MGRRIAIVGAGVIGLLTARLLLARGHHVVVVDQREPGREASWAGGGIVSPLYPWRYSSAVTALATHAIEAYRALASTLLSETGIDPEFHACGLLMLDPPERDQATRWCAQQQRRVTFVDRQAIDLLQLGLGIATSGLWFPDLGNVRNPRLLQALRAAVENHPHARCHWHAQVALDGHTRGVVAINGKQIAIDQVVVAAGAWSGELLRPLGIDIKVAPVRGQMLLYPPKPGLLGCIVLRDGRYLIPRRDGRILAGSTLEHTGFDCSITAEANASLRESAARMLPALAREEPEMQWAGLRPGSPSGIPWIDIVSGGRLLINAGHFRNGLVLAPAAAQLGVELLLDEQPSIDPAPYRVLAPRPPPEI